ncbi:hypothetical protein BV898_02114 [Hypsibius exemplaris]|uniref:G-protein coupled receptors family 1 profile domain-containing protein n=1 Tax=Hypsibius exemplaris TaxID=2072580 RepID=A0A1W0X9U2_HYPEX|nr:hypothetical protein BV898_02114 [Hypsibius exemplaris]
MAANATVMNSTRTGSALLMLVLLPKVPISLSYCGFAINAVAGLLNLFIMVVFLRCPRLITAFTVHVVSMTATNLGVCVMQFMLLVINVNTVVMFEGRVFCGFFKYFIWTMTSINALQQCVLCADRWLAVLWPFWYRNKSVSSGVKTSLAVFVVQQSIFLPLFVADMLKMKAQDTPRNYCVTTAWSSYQLVVRNVTFLAPEGFLIVNYPLLLGLIWKRRRNRLRSLRRLHPLPPPPPPHLIVAHANNTSAAVNARNDARTAQRTRKEINLVQWLLLLQILFWVPLTTFSVLIGARSRLSHVVDANFIMLVVATVLPALEVVTYLRLLGDLRRETFRFVKRLFRCGAG